VAKDPLADGAMRLVRTSLCRSHGRSTNISELAILEMVRREQICQALKSS